MMAMRCRVWCPACGEKVLVAHWDRLFFWDSRTGALEWELATSRSVWARISVSRGGARAFAAVAEGKPLLSLHGRMAGQIDALTLSPAGDFVATCVQVRGSDREPDAEERLRTQIQVWHAASGRSLHRFQGGPLTAGGRCSVDLFPTAEVLAGVLAL